MAPGFWRRFCNELSGQLVKNRLSDNVGGVKQFLGALSVRSWKRAISL
jgi:hypothetical protein